MPVLGLLLQRQFFGFLTGPAALSFVGQKHLRYALISQVRTTRRSGILRWCLALLVQRFVWQWAGVAWLNCKNFAAFIRDDLRLEGVTLLFAGVKLPLDSGQTGSGNRCLEAVDQHYVKRIGMPGRFFLGPLLFGVPAVGRAEAGGEAAPHRESYSR